MADRSENFQERLYDISNLNIWFAISSLIFLAVLIWSFVDDYTNDWKDYQREFRTLQVEKTKEESYRYIWGHGESRRVPYISTRTTISRVDND